MISEPAPSGCGLGPGLAWLAELKPKNLQPQKVAGHRGPGLDPKKFRKTFLRGIPSFLGTLLLGMG